MIRRELRKLKTEPKELRQFGLLVGGVCLALAGWMFWRGKPGALFLLGLALPLMALGILRPTLLKWPYLGWMSLGIALGVVVSTLLLTLLFYLVVTPLGLAARLTGKDFLQLRLERSAASYWIPRSQTRPRKPQDYERQF